MNNREGMLDKIRALMSKTTENGCTEAEALAALSKARAMMDVYEVSDEELKLTKEESAILHPDTSKDRHSIRRNLGIAIAKFCDCDVWYSPRPPKKGLTFCGLKSDVEFASWLLDSLQQFVEHEMVTHLLGSLWELKSPREKRLAKDSFAMGATRRIAERLLALVKQSREASVGNSRALVVTKQNLIEEAKEKAGIRLKSGRRSSRHVDRGSFNAGMSAGDRASFGRPVSGAGAVLRLGR